MRRWQGALDIRGSQHCCMAALPFPAQQGRGGLDSRKVVGPGWKEPELALQVAFTAELRRRLPPDCGVVASAVHPGEVLTNVVSSLPALMQSLYRVVMFPFCLTPAEGAWLAPPVPLALTVVLVCDRIHV